MDPAAFRSPVVWWRPACEAQSPKKERVVQAGRSGRRRGRGPEVVEAVADGRAIPRRSLGGHPFSLQDSSSCERRLLLSCLAGDLDSPRRALPE